MNQDKTDIKSISAIFYNDIAGRRGIKRTPGEKIIHEWKVVTGIDRQGVIYILNNLQCNWYKALDFYRSQGRLPNEKEQSALSRLSFKELDCALSFLSIQRVRQLKKSITKEYIEKLFSKEKNKL